MFISKKGWLYKYPDILISGYILFFITFLLQKPAFAVDEIRQRSLMFAGVEISSNSQYFHTGIRQSLAGHIENTGWIFDVSYGLGTYHYKNTNAPGGKIEASFAILDAAFGYHYRWDKGGISVLAGVHGEDHILSAFDPGNVVQGEKFGVSGKLDIWAKPTPDILITAYGSVTNVYGGYYGRLYIGHRIPQLWNAFVGPELAILGNQTYMETRFGIQANSIPLGEFGITISAGISQNQDSRHSLYGSLNMWRQFDLQRMIKLTPNFWDVFDIE